MAINFPTDPEVDDVHTSSGQSWRWTGTYWLSLDGASAYHIGADEPDDPLPGDHWFDTDDGTEYVYIDGEWVATNGPAIATFGAGLALDNAHLMTMAGRRNRVVNPGMRFSQELGTTGSSADATYPVDNFYHGKVHDGTCTWAQVAAATPGGSTHRLRGTVSGTDASIGAAQIGVILHPLEGQRMADALFGTADAKPLIVRFGFKAPAGTYCVAIRNTAVDRSFVREFTATGSDQVVEVTFPGCTDGTWATTSAQWGHIVWTFAAGSNFQGAADSWNSANDVATSNQFNLLGVNAQEMEIFDVGLYVDFEGAGVPPQFELPDYQADFELCQRYFWRLSGAAGSDCPLLGIGYNSSTTAGLLTFRPPRMRAVPTLALSNVTHFAVYRNNGVQEALTALTIAATSNTEAWRINYTVNANLIGGECTSLTNSSTSARMDFNARLI